jgi:hypothetical protein
MRFDVREGNEGYRIDRRDVVVSADTLAGLPFSGSAESLQTLWLGFCPWVLSIFRTHSLLLARWRILRYFLVVVHRT